MPKHEGYHRIETAEMDRVQWRKQMGFPHPDAGTNLGPPSLKEDTEYYLTRIDGQVLRLKEMFDKVGGGELDVPMFKTLNTIQAFLTSLRGTLNAS